jgi:hypothetical protein
VEHHRPHRATPRHPVLDFDDFLQPWLSFSSLPAIPLPLVDSDFLEFSPSLPSNSPRLDDKNRAEMVWNSATDDPRLLQGKQRSTVLIVPGLERLVGTM